MKNWWVLICIRFTCTTGCSPTTTVALSHRRQYIEDRQSEPIELLSVLSGDFQSFDEILAEDNGMKTRNTHDFRVNSVIRHGQAAKTVSSPTNFLRTHKEEDA